MKSCEATGKNIEQAIENALLQLRASREDVDIKILSEGGFLKKAKVLVSISADALEKYEKKEQVRKALVEEDERENDDDFAENFLKKKVSSGEKESEKERAEKESAEKVEKSAKFGEKTEKNIKKTEKNDVKAEKSTQNAENGADGLRGAESAQNAEQGAKKSHVKIYADDEISSSKPKRASVQAADEQGSKAEGKTLRNRISGEEFLQGVLKSLGLEGEIEKTEDEKFVRYSLSGENMNDLIGYHGECMLALSYLMNTACTAPEHKRLVLDVSDYRAKREESLIALAKRIADKVAKSGRYYKLEPMDASERKIIHTALQDDERVTTLSKGEEPHRYLMVFPKEYSDRD